MAGKRVVFLHLPSKDIDASERFITSLGFTNKGGCPDGSCWFGHSDTSISLFYHNHKTFGSYLPDGSTVHTYNAGAAPATTEVIITLTTETKEEVDSMVARAIEAGATKAPMKVSEEEQMKCNLYTRSVVDPDGHLFEIAHCPDASSRTGACVGY